MGLRSMIDKAVGTAFKVAGDIPQTLNYNSITIGAYNPATGTTDTTTITHSIQYIPDAYKAHEIDGEAIKPHDHRVIIRQSTLPVVPKLTDTVVIDLVTWNVVHFEQDPASATWTLQLRMA